MPYNTEKLQERIADRFGTQKAFAEALGVNESTISRYLNEGGEWKGSTLINAINLLKIPKSEIDSYFFESAVGKKQQEEG